jgi:hypothetical protein
MNQLAYRQAKPLNSHARYRSCCGNQLRRGGGRGVEMAYVVIDADLRGGGVAWRWCSRFVIVGGRRGELFPWSIGYVIWPRCLCFYRVLGSVWINQYVGKQPRSRYCGKSRAAYRLASCGRPSSRVHDARSRCAGEDVLIYGGDL